MSVSIEKILIANEKLNGLERAVEKAATLEHYSGAELTLMEVVYDPIEREPDDILPRDEKTQLITAFLAAEKEGLRQIAETFSDKVASLQTETLWSPNKEAAIAQYAQRHQVDLIIKPKASRDWSDRAMRDSSESRLLATTDCPVLISQVPDWTDNRGIIACVEVADPHHRELNQNILKNAHQFAILLNLPLHLLNVGPDPELSLGRFSRSFDVLGMEDKMYQARRAEMEQLCTELPTADIEIHKHMLRGSIPDAVQKTADENNANLVVVGTAARTGISRLMIGNTADAILQNVDADLLCIPDARHAQA